RLTRGFPRARLKPTRSHLLEHLLAALRLLLERVVCLKGAEEPRSRALADAAAPGGDLRLAQVRGDVLLVTGLAARGHDAGLVAARAFRDRKARAEHRALVAELIGHVIGKRFGPVGFDDEIRTLRALLG